MKNFFKKYPNLIKVLPNIGWLSIDSGIRLIIGIIIGAWVARYLGPTQFGMLNYAIAFVALFTPMALLGLDYIVIRDIVNEPDKKDKFLGTAFILRLLCGIIVSIIICLVIISLGSADSVSKYLVFIISMITILQSADVVDLYFQSQVRSKFIVLGKFPSLFISFAIRIFLIMTKAPLIWFAGAVFMEALLNAIGLFIVYRLRNGHLSSWKFDFHIAENLLQGSWPMLVASLSAMIYAKIDQVMLAYYLGPRAVGIYSAAVRVSEMGYVVGSIIIASAFPAIMAVRNFDEAAYQKSYQKLLIFLAGFGCFFSLLITIFSNLIIYILFGHAYEEAAKVLSWHVWGMVFVYLGGVTTYALIVEGLQKYHMIRTLLACLFNIGMNLILIPKWGIMGAVISTITSYAISVFSIVFFRQAKSVAFGFKH